MKLFSNIKNAISRLPRKVVLTAVMLGVLIGIPVSVVIAEFYPNRPVFDYNNADQRVGSMNGPVFNSFINTPSYGDERAFLDARRSDQTAAGSYKNVLNDVTEGSKEVVVRMYVHNNANQSTNESGLGIAKNAKVRVALPGGTAESLRARGYISADNAAMVEDTVDFTANEAFSVSYIPGSATIYSNGAVNGSALSDDIVTTGALIGHDKLDGNLPGCFEYEAVVQIRVKVTPKENPNVKLTKEVRKKGDKDWKKEVSVKVGEEVEWLITTEVTGEGALNNNIVRDVLPPHVQLTPGTVKWIDAQQNAVQNDKPLFDGGINTGNYASGSGFYITFATKTTGDFKECETRVRNVAYHKSNETPEIQDDADVIITREPCDDTKKPVYNCDGIVKAFQNGRTYRFTTNATAQNGATIKQYRYTFTGNGYNQSSLVNTANGQVDHTFPQPGSYTVAVTVDFTVNGQTASNTSQACMTKIDIPKEGENCPVPGKEHLPKNSPECKVTPPTTLVETGPGDVVGIFAAVTIAGAVAHRFILGRRFN